MNNDTGLNLSWINITETYKDNSISYDVIKVIQCYNTNIGNGAPCVKTESVLILFTHYYLLITNNKLSDFEEIKKVNMNKWLLTFFVSMAAIWILVSFLNDFKSTLYKCIYVPG